MRKRKRGLLRIPVSWYSILPGQGLAFWVRVERLRKTRGVRKRDRAGISQLATEVFMKGVT